MTSVRPPLLLLAILLFVSCSSAEISKPDERSMISLQEVADDLRGIYYWDEASFRGVVEVGTWRLIAMPELNRLLLGDAELQLTDPVQQYEQDLFFSREFYEDHLKPLARLQADVGLPPATTAGPNPARTASAPATSTPSEGQLAGWTVAVDAGHGGRDQGASVGAVLEKDITLRVGRHLAQELRDAGARVIMTRTSDRYVGLDRRVSMSAGSDLFVSIHANSCPHAHVRGVEVFIKSSPMGAMVVDRSRDLAGRIALAISNSGMTPNRGVKRNVRQLRVLRKSRIPAVLVEMGFLTNHQERRNLIDQGYQRRLAAGVARGILGHVRAMGG